MMAMRCPVNDGQRHSGEALKSRHRITKEHDMTYDFQIFMIEKGDRVLIASYYTQSELPTVGMVLNIDLFKEEERFPNRVRVRSVDVPTAPRSSEVQPVRVDLLVDPV